MGLARTSSRRPVANGSHSELIRIPDPFFGSRARKQPLEAEIEDTPPRMESDEDQQNGKIFLEKVRPLDQSWGALWLELRGEASRGGEEAPGGRSTDEGRRKTSADRGSNLDHPRSLKAVVRRQNHDTISEGGELEQG